MIDEYGNKDARIRISFSLTDEFGNQFTATNSYEHIDIDVNEIEEIGTYFNTFLKQCGYYRENDYLCMTDLTLEELEKVEDFIDELRHPDVDDEPVVQREEDDEPVVQHKEEDGIVPEADWD